ncbi:MAG: hypothetical protein F6K31_29580 [Symploca sp. SIO2G7]|nr:hypothetical protein [Symploca sp. SIO2G7]
MSLTNYKKNKKVAGLLALLGALQPTPVPIAGVHKLYMGQYGWGLIYLLLGATQVPRIASAVDAMWFLLIPQLKVSLAENMTIAFSNAQVIADGATPEQAVALMANSLREIEQLRQEGLLSEHEFEQKRRWLLEQLP